MSAIHLNNRLVHYEVIGRRGLPIIFLHSWLGSWRYWLPTMDSISDRHRTYALDFWGFGESDRHESTFSVSEYVAMLIDFMNNLGLEKVALVGHGLGGMVAIHAVSKHPQRFTKVVAVTTPIQGSVIQSFVRPGAFARLLGRANSNNLWSRQLRQLNVDYPQILDEIIEDTESLSEAGVKRVIDSVLETDLRADLGRLEVPLLAVFGERDGIVPSEQARFFHDDHAQLQQVIKLPKSNHFPFLDQPNVFNRMLTDFMSSTGTPIELKSEWRRRVNQIEYI
ncbi:MAG: alpha/beta hydrolase [Roseiflexaceae bacterium]|nr:alpha/beta hydrolase [Roseiflexaceae bacterium]